MGKKVFRTPQEKIMTTLNKMQENTEKAKKLHEELDIIISKLPELDRQKYYKITQELQELENEYKDNSSGLLFSDFDDDLLDISLNGHYVARVQNSKITAEDGPGPRGVDPSRKGHHKTEGDPPPKQLHKSDDDSPKGNHGTGNDPPS